MPNSLAFLLPNSVLAHIANAEEYGIRVLHLL